MISLVSRTRSGSELDQPENFGGVAYRRQRVAQFVRQHCQKLILTTICFSQGLFALPQCDRRLLDLGDVFGNAKQ